MATARNVCAWRRAGDVQVNAVEIVAGLFGRDGELGLVDEALEIGGLEREFVRHLAGSKIGKVALRQSLQCEPRTAGADRQRGAVAGGFQHDLRALGQLAHDVVEHVRGHRGRSAGRGFGGDGVGHFEIEVGRLQAQLRAVGAKQHVGENGNGVAPLYRAMHMPERPQQFGTLYGDLHRKNPFTNTRVGKVAWRGAFGKGGARPARLFPGVSHSNKAKAAGLRSTIAARNDRRPGGLSRPRLAPFLGQPSSRFLNPAADA